MGLTDLLGGDKGVEAHPQGVFAIIERGDCIDPGGELQTSKRESVRVRKRGN